jgi:hypothetical protein
MDVALLEKLSVFAARTHILPFLKDFDRLNTRRIDPEQGVRALLSAGLPLSKEEQGQIKAAYTGEDGKFVYDALIGDGACLLCVCVCHLAHRPTCCHFSRTLPPLTPPSQLTMCAPWASSRATRSRTLR